METFTMIAGTCSILSLIVSLFVAGKVMQINQSIRVKGKGNITAGRDIRA